MAFSLYVNQDNANIYYVDFRIIYMHVQAYDVQPHAVMSVSMYIHDQATYVCIYVDIHITLCDHKYAYMDTIKAYNADQHRFVCDEAICC